MGGRGKEKRSWSPANPDARSMLTRASFRASRFALRSPSFSRSITHDVGPDDELERLPERHEHDQRGFSRAMDTSERDKYADERRRPRRSTIAGFTPPGPSAARRTYSIKARSEQVRDGGDNAHLQRRSGAEACRRSFGPGRFLLPAARCQRANPRRTGLAR